MGQNVCTMCWSSGQQACLLANNSSLSPTYALSFLSFVNLGLNNVGTRNHCCYIVIKCLFKRGDLKGG